MQLQTKWNFISMYLGNFYTLVYERFTKVITCLSCLRFCYLRWAHTHIRECVCCEIAVLRTTLGRLWVITWCWHWFTFWFIGAIKRHLTAISWTCLDFFTLSEWFTHPRSSIYSKVQSLCSCELPSGYECLGLLMCVCVLVSKAKISCLWERFVQEYVSASVWSSTKHLKCKLFACSYIDISAERYQTVCW